MINKLKILPCLDSPEMAQQRQRELNVKTPIAAALGTSAVELALNFANGIEPGGGFLHGARAQEEGAKGL